MRPMTNQTGMHLREAAFGDGTAAEQRSDRLAAFDIDTAVGSLTAAFFEEIFSSLRSALLLQGN